MNVDTKAHLHAGAQASAQRLLDAVKGITSVVVATVDGFDVASCIQGGAEPSRIAAMASSIAAIGSVISQEAGLGHYSSVTINTEAGFVVVYAVPRDGVAMVVNVIANRDAIFAQVAYHAGRMVRELAAL